MLLVGKIKREIYSCITEDIKTDEVIITEERVQHIKDRHPNDVGRILRTFKIKKNVEVTDNGKIII